MRLLSERTTSKQRRALAGRRPSFESLEARCVLSSPGRVIQPGITLFKLDHPDVRPSQIVAGADGNQWFNEIVTNRIGKITPEGEISSFPIDTSGSILSLAPGSDGATWFTNSEGQIGRITPDEKVTYLPLNLPYGAAFLPQTIALGADGDIWFPVSVPSLGTSGVSKISPSGVTTFYQLQTSSGVASTCAGPDGDMWFIELSGHVLGKLTPTGEVTEYSLDPVQRGFGGFISSLTTGPNGNIWFTFQQDNQIGEVTPEGDFTVFNLPTDTRPGSITAGPDGNLWFSAHHAIGRITPEGIVSQFNLSPDLTAYGLAKGADNNIWFTVISDDLAGDGSIGRLDPTALGSGTSIAVSVTQGTAFTGSVARVTLPSPEGAVATIDWGDGHMTPATLSPDGTGGYMVIGTVDYAAAGAYPLTVSITTASGVQLLIPGAMQVMANPNADFVTHLYERVLGRSAEESGAAYWLIQMGAGASRAQVALKIENSPEGQSELVDQMYTRYLGRHVESGGMIACLSMLQMGGSQQDVAAMILSSPEILAHSGGTANGFLSSLFQDVLLRGIDSGTLLTLAQQLAQAPTAATRFLIARAVLLSPESVQAQVKLDYQSILGRNADPAGLAEWSGLNAFGISDDVVRAGLLGSDEFFGLAAS
jgi:streptogramin lyase